MSFGSITIRFIKYTLIFLAVFLVSSSIAVFVVLNKVPTINSDKAILILGKGGEGHTAPNLTDTIMVAYLNPQTKKTSILSLPRDIWVSEIRAKLNTAYHYGGFKMAGDSLYSLTNKGISNTIIVDFSLFKDLVDAIGGIEVDVQNSFTDEKYPIEGRENDLCDGDRTYACRYETIVFNSGIQKMDGELALKFVRSRNSKGEEGTDLAREIRQQKVVSAVKEKITSREVITNFKMIKELYNIAINHVETDIKPVDFLSLLKFGYESRNNIQFLSFPEELVVVSKNDKKYDMQYVFIPKDGSWKKLQEWISQRI